MKFEYKRPEDTKLEAYGKVFEIPPKTAYLIDEIQKVTDRINAENCSTYEQVQALRDGISLFIGEEEAEKIFPRDDLLKSVNSEEITAFWFCLNQLSNKESEAVIAKYAPKPKEEIKVSTNPKK